ncbi:uncharacterized protein [Dysidea avara]|uniref:uncharacterized protein n=1 Tax=Dysidea avara TaxID=196820 RepID=UPI00332CB816
MLHIVGCSVTSNGLRSIAHMLHRNKTLQWIGLDKNRSTLTEGDIIMLLQTIRYRNNTVFMIFIDNAFHTSDNIQELLQILNYTREQRGVRKLSLTLMDCFKRRETFEWIVSTIPFIQNQSPSSITTRVLQYEKQEAVQSPSNAIATTGDLQSEQQETMQSSSSVSTRDEESKQEKTIFFGEYPIKIVCPKCNEEMDTKTTFKIGSLTLILVMALFCTCWLTLFMLWPLCLDLCKDVCHSCSKCKTHLGVYKRL